jgi:hypothetical protein
MSIGARGVAATGRERGYSTKSGSKPAAKPRARGANAGLLKDNARARKAGEGQSLPPALR